MYDLPDMLDGLRMLPPAVDVFFPPEITGPLPVSPWPTVAPMPFPATYQAKTTAKVKQLLSDTSLQLRICRSDQPKPLIMQQEQALVIWSHTKYPVLEGPSGQLNTSMTALEVMIVLQLFCQMMMAHFNIMLMVHANICLTFACLSSKFASFCCPFKSSPSHLWACLMLDWPSLMTEMYCDSWGPRDLEGCSASAET